MPYEDPIEAALRSLTDVAWVKRKDGSFEARINKTHAVGIAQMLEDHNIASHAEVSAARSGRYMIRVEASEVPKILKAVAATGAEARPHRKKWRSSP